LDKIFLNIKSKGANMNIIQMFGLFRKKNGQKNIDNIIKNDPVLKKLDKEIGDLNQKAGERLKNDVEAMKILKKLGIEIK
jgi:DNA-directed RNA polymerase subunit H (RpoH/RPB5)